MLRRLEMIGVFTCIASTLIASPLPSPAEQPGVDDLQSSIVHLPDAVQRDITGWRNRLLEGKCLKVSMETDQTWVNLHDLDDTATPRLVLRERFSVQSWMTPDSLWVTVFPYKNDVVDSTRPLFQLYWSAPKATAWERQWDETASAYTARQYECAEPAGPTDIDFGSRGCIFASATQTWLAGPPDLAQREITTRSVGLMRIPNLAMVPPDPHQPGIWLDVFWETVKRDQDIEFESLYRRHDFMLLTRDGAGRPELREWRTLVLSDPTQGGKKAQQITGISRFAYTFHETEPAEFKDATAAFVRDVTQMLAK